MERMTLLELLLLVALVLLAVARVSAELWAFVEESER